MAAGCQTAKEAAQCLTKSQGSAGSSCKDKNFVTQGCTIPLQAHPPSPSRSRQGEEKRQRHAERSQERPGRDQRETRERDKVSHRGSTRSKFGTKPRPHVSEGRPLSPWLSPQSPSYSSSYPCPAAMAASLLPPGCSLGDLGSPRSMKELAAFSLGPEKSQFITPWLCLYQVGLAGMQLPAGAAQG